MYGQEQLSFVCGTPEPTHFTSNEINKGTSTATSPCPDANSFFHIRTVVHYFLRPDGTGNFTEFDDGRTNDPIPSGEPSNHHQLWNGYRFAAELIHAANANWLRNNQPLASSSTSCTISVPPPVQNIKIQYTLVGVYFHRVSESDYNYIHSSACNAHHYLTTLYPSYHVNPSNTLNVVLGAFSYADGCVPGIPAPSNKMVCSADNIWDKYSYFGSWANIVWGFIPAPALVHETGHLLNLYHTFQSPSDNCADTPPCGQGTTNNIMDYGVNQHALTPDQLTRMYNALNGTSVSYIPNYQYACSPCSPAHSFMDVYEKCGKVYLAGGWYGTWENPNNQFIEIFETNTYGSNTVLDNYYSQWFNNVGPEAHLRNLKASPINYTFQPNKIYKIKLAVQNNCTNWHENSKWIKYSGAINSQECGGGGGSSNGTARITTTEKTVHLYPNPTSNELNIVLPESPEIPVQAILTDITGKTIQTVTLQDIHTKWEVNLPKGMYILHIQQYNTIQKIIIQ